MKRLVIFALIFTFCLTSLSSCTLVQDTQEAEALLKDFVSAIANKDFEKAMTYIHPASGITQTDLEEAITEFESNFNIDLSKGVEFQERTQLRTHSSSNVYPKQTQTQIFLGYNALIDGKTFDLEAVVCKNEGGFGILSFSLTMGIELSSSYAEFITK